MNNHYNDPDKGSFPPWSRIPSFKEMADDIGLDHDQFIKLIEKGESAESIAEQMGVSPETAQILYDHFMRYGISSVMGGD